MAYSLLFENQNHFDPGNEFILIDEDGITKSHEIATLIPIQIEQQYDHFYNEDSISFLAYYGNAYGMAAFMTCRWGKSIS